MANESRKYTRALLEALDERILEPKEIVLMCVNYMSEQEVQDMVESNDLAEALGMEESE